MASRGAEARRPGRRVGLVALLFILLVWALVTDEGGELASSGRGATARRRRTFALERLDAEGELALSSLRGKAVVLNFWASWCIPCKEEAPFLEQVWREHRDRGLVVLGVDAKDFRGDARRFVRRFGLTFPIVFDGEGDDARRLRRHGLPGDLRHRPARAGSSTRSSAVSTPTRTRAAARRDRAGARDVRPRLAARGSLVACAPCPRRREAQEPAERGGSRGRARLPGLQDDARPVGRAGRRAHEALHPRADRGRRRDDQIKDELVAEFGRRVLAEPPKGGFGLLAWLLPLGALVGGGRRRRCSSGRGAAGAGAAADAARPRPGARAPRRRGARAVRGD